MSESKPMRKGLRGAPGIKSALDADVDVSRFGASAQSAAGTQPERLVQRQPVQPVPVEPERALDPYRGRGRTQADDELKNVTITLPASVLTNADMFVLRRKHSASTYNRSTLIQEALIEYLKNHSE